MSIKPAIKTASTQRNPARMTFCQPTLHMYTYMYRSHTFYPSSSSQLKCFGQRITFRNLLFSRVSCIIPGFLGNIRNQCQNVWCNIVPAMPLRSEVLIVWSGLHKHIWSEGQGYANIKDAWKYASIRYAWNSFNAFPQCIGAVRSILHSAEQCKLLMMKVRNAKEYILHIFCRVHRKQRGAKLPMRGVPRSILCNVKQS